MVKRGWALINMLSVCVRCFSTAMEMTSVIMHNIWIEFGRKSADIRGDK